MRLLTCFSCVFAPAWQTVFVGLAEEIRGKASSRWFLVLVGLHVLGGWRRGLHRSEAFSFPIRKIAGAPADTCEVLGGFL